MKRFHKSRVKRGFALTTILSLLALGGIAPMASAGPPPPPPAATLDPANIDAAQDGKGSLTIHKLEDPTWNGSNDGTELTIPTTHTDKYLNGVEFTLYKVTKNGVAIDLKTPEGWATYQGLHFDKATGAFTGATAAGITIDNTGTPMSTSDQGMAVFDNLAFGVYVVKETNVTNAVDKDGNKVNIVRKADPFMVTIPLPNITAENKTKWLYKVHAYPKNSTSTVEKVLDPNTEVKQYNVGDILNWDITVEIPQPAEEIAGMRVTDTLDKNLDFKQVNKDAVVVKLGTATVPADKYDVTGVNERTVTITFNTDFINANKGKTLNIKLPTTIVTIPEDNQIPNQGANAEFQNTPGGDWDKVPPSTNPTANFGGFAFKKVSRDGDQPLKGAEFKMYKTEQDATNGNNEVATAISDDNGIVKFENLFLGNNDTKSRIYYYKETKAPNGYVLDGQIREANVTTAPINLDALELKIPNTQSTVPELPTTGAILGTVLPILGIGLLVIGGIFMIVSRRKNDQNNA